MTRSLLLSAVACTALLAAACSSSSGPDDSSSGEPGPGANATWDRRFGDDTLHPNRVLITGSTRRLVLLNGKLHGVGYADVVLPGSVRYNGVFTWDSTNIAPLPSLLGNGTPTFDGALDAAVVGNAMYVIADFDNNGGRLAKWDGSSWSYQDVGMELRNLEGGGALYTYTSTIDTSMVMRLNGSTFEIVGGRGFSGNTEQVVSIAGDANTVYVATKKTNGVGVTGKTWVYRLDGSAWTRIGELEGTGDFIEKIGGDIYVLGRFRGDVTVPVMKWSGNTWEKIAGEIEDDSYSFVGIARDRSGNLYVAKETTVYKMSGGNATLAATVAGGSIRSILLMGNQLILGGAFFQVSGTISQYFAVLR